MKPEARSVMRRKVFFTFAVASGVAALAAVPTWLSLFAPDAQGVTRTGSYFGLDFVNFWSAGRLVIEGRVAEAYNAAQYRAVLETWFAPATSFTNLSYPPGLLPLLAPIAMLPYGLALACWTVLGVIAFLSAVLGRMPTRRDAGMIALLAISPIVISNLVFGQIALFAAALFIWAFRLLETKPVAAGCLIGLLTIKPQLGVLMPLFLMAAGAWRAAAAATVTALALFGFSVLLFGLEPWGLYLTDTAALQWSYIQRMDDFYAIHMISPYAAFWTLGLNVDAALTGQWGVSAAVAIATLAVARSGAELPLKAAFVAIGTVMAMPYVLAHDLAVPFAALAWLLTASAMPLSKYEWMLIGVAWMLPFPATFLLQLKGIPATEIALAVIYGCLLWRALVAHRSALESGGPQPIPI